MADDPYSIERPEVDAIRRALGFQASLIRTREPNNDQHLTNVVKDGLNAALDMADRITTLETDNQRLTDENHDLWAVLQQHGVTFILGTIGDDNG